MSDQPIVLDNATVLDVIKGQLLSKHRVVIVGNRIDRVEPVEVEKPNGHVINVGGKTVMPGLCDAHVHATAWTAHLSQLLRSSPSYTAARAAVLLEAMLMRGFTTVRDGGGADFGLAMAVEEGYIAGPRLLICGHALSPTAGHGDMRARGEEVVAGLNDSLMLGRICDGVSEVRRACRDEIRKGAHHIKLMVNGGIASPTDRISNNQFSEDEIRAAVEEAEMAGLYCMSHNYTAKSVNRAIKLGVRSLEHCNLIDKSTIDLLLKHDAFMVPTLSTYEALATEGVQAGLPTTLAEKIPPVAEGGLKALEMAHKAGVKLAYGTDLIGNMQRHQLNEFRIRAQVQPAIDIIRGATCLAAELFNEVGEIGVVAPGARADLLVVDGDPLTDLDCLQNPDRYLNIIMKNGKFYKNTLQ